MEENSAQDRSIQIERAQNIWSSFERSIEPLARGTHILPDPSLEFSDIGGLDGEDSLVHPKSLAGEMAIMEQEARRVGASSLPLRVPDFIKEIISRFTMEARGAPEVNQASGVSVRVSINNYETVLANAEKRAVSCGETEIVPRISDLHSMFASTNGKLELEYGAEQEGDGSLVDRLLGRAVKGAFDEHVDASTLEPLIEYLGEGWGLAVSDTMPSASYLEGISSIEALKDVLDTLGPFESPGLMVAAAEFVLEGLHLHDKLNRRREGGRLSYMS